MMKQKTQLKSLELKDQYDIEDEDLKEEVKFEIDKNAFKGPFICHSKKTILKDKEVSFNGLNFNYSVWSCSKCGKEYLDSEQGKKFEKFLLIKNILKDDLITIERNMNYDGKTFFFRFPKELNSNLHKKDLVDIKLLSTTGNLFLVEIKHKH